MRLVSYQPQYFPRLYYFARILAADVFAVGDYLQFVRKHAYEKPDGSRPIGPSYQAHTPIKTAGGEMLIDVPTRHAGLQSIHETQLAFATPKERLRNFRLLEAHYRKAPRFRSLQPELQAFFERPHITLAELNIDSIFFSLALLLDLPGNSLREEILHALAASQYRLRTIALFSETGIPPSNKEDGRDANQWLVDACRHFGATEYYYGGTAASAYMDMRAFTDAGITLVQQDWKCPHYEQLHGDFIPNLSILDLLMNVEPAEARDIVFTPNQ